MFGFATDKQVRKLGDHINSIEYSEAFLQSKMKQFGETLEAFMSVSDDRYTKITNALIDSNLKITNRINTFVDAVNKKFYAFLTNLQLFKAFQLQLSHIFISSFDYFAYNLELTTSAESILTQWLTASELLIRNKLPVSFVPPHQLKIALDHVMDILTKQNKNLELTFTDTAYYYNHASVVSSHTDSCLYMMLAIPLKTKDDVHQLYKVYQVFSFPITTPTNSSMTTIQNLPDMYAVTIDDKYSFDMDIKTWMACTGFSIKTCLSPISVRILEAKTCVDTLYLDVPELVAELCEIHVTKLPSVPVFLKYENYAIISGSKSKFILDCSNQPVKELQPCPLVCVLKLPCNCNIQSTNHIIRQTSYFCDKNSKQIESYYGNNLPFLTKYFGKKILPKNWKGHTMFKQSAYYEIPRIPESFIKQFDKKLNSTNVNDRNVMNHLILHTKEDTSDVQAIPIQSAIFSDSDSSDIITLISLLVSIFSLLLSFFLLWKVRKMLIIIAMLQSKISDTTADKISILDHYPTVSPSVSTSTPCESPENDITPYVTFLCLCVLLLLILLIVLYCKGKLNNQRNNTLSFHLLLFTCKESVSVKLFDVPTDLSNIDLHGKNILHTVTVKQKCLLHSLIIKWNDIRIELKGIKVLLPDRYSLSPMSAFKVTNIITKPFHSILYVKSGPLLLGTVGEIEADSSVYNPVIFTKNNVAYSSHVFAKNKDETEVKVL